MGGAFCPFQTYLDRSFDSQVLCTQSQFCTGACGILWQLLGRVTAFFIKDIQPIFALSCLYSQVPRGFGQTSRNQNFLVSCKILASIYLHLQILYMSNTFLVVLVEAFFEFQFQLSAATRGCLQLPPNYEQVRSTAEASLHFGEDSETSLKLGIDAGLDPTCATDLQ